MGRCVATEATCQNSSICKSHGACGVVCIAPEEWKLNSKPLIWMYPFACCPTIVSHCREYDGCKQSGPSAPDQLSGKCKLSAEKTNAMHFGMDLSDSPKIFVQCYTCVE